MIKKRLILLFVLLLPHALWASDAERIGYSINKNNEAILTVDLFLSTDCPYCKKADSFFKTVEPKYQWLHVNRHFINQDKNALLLFNQLLNEQNLNDFSVPSLFFCNSRWVGFASEKTTGNELLKALNYCKQQIESNKGLNSTTETVLKRWANASLFNSSITENPSALQYLVFVALMDALNPCAFFGFAGFLAVLFLQDKRNTQIVVGMLYVAAVGLTHYFQQTQTGLFYELLPWLRIPAFLTGVIGLYCLYAYFKHSLTWVLMGVSIVLTGLMIQTYQQTCVMNWSYIFEQWLSDQHLSDGQLILFQLSYQVLYSLPLIVILVFYLWTNKVQRLRSIGVKLRHIGLLILLAINLLLLVHPETLSNFWFSLLILFIMGVSGWFFKLNKPLS